MVVNFLGIIDFQSQVLFKIAFNKTSKKFDLISWYLVVGQIWISLSYSILLAWYISWRIVSFLDRLYAIATFIVYLVLVYSEKLIVRFRLYLSWFYPWFYVNLGGVNILTMSIQPCRLRWISHSSRRLWFLHVSCFILIEFIIKIEAFNAFYIAQHIILALEYGISVWQSSCTFEVLLFIASNYENIWV